MFAVLVAGQLVQTDYVQVGEAQYSFSLQNAQSLHHLAVFLTGAAPLAADTGCIVYFSLPPYQDWQVLGYITNEKPSAIFAVKHPKDVDSKSIVQYQGGWEYAQQVPSQYFHVVCSTESKTIDEQSRKESQNCAQIGIEIVPLTSIQHMFGDKSVSTSTVKTIASYCEKMLQQFFNYGQSFIVDVVVDPATNRTEAIIPARVFENWYTQFLKKLQQNPYFWRD